MKAKTKKRLIIWLAILVAVAIIGYFGYRAALVFVGDKAMDVLLQNQLNSMLDSGEITLEELEAIAESDPTADTQPEDTPQKEVPSEQAQSTKQNPEASEFSAEAQQQPAESQQQPAAQKTPASPSTSSERKETVKKAADNIGFGITREDKEAMAKLITSRLSGGDIAYLSGLLSGGLTRDERAEAYKIAVARFSGAELSQVSSFYHKYKKAIMIEPDYGVEE